MAYRKSGGPWQQWGAARWSAARLAAALPAVQIKAQPKSSKSGGTFRYFATDQPMAGMVAADEAVMDEQQPQGASAFVPGGGRDGGGGSSDTAHGTNTNGDGTERANQVPTVAPYLERIIPAREFFDVFMGKAAPMFAGSGGAGAGAGAGTGSRAARGETSTSTAAVVEEEWYAAGPVDDVLPPAMRARDIGDPASLFETPSASHVGGGAGAGSGHEGPPFASCCELNVWLTLRGTAAAGHYDTSHNLHVVLSGTKEFVLLPPSAHRQGVRACTTCCDSHVAIWSCV
jgi:hypothetical protein